MQIITLGWTKKPDYNNSLIIKWRSQISANRLIHEWTDCCRSSLIQKQRRRRACGRWRQQKGQSVTNKPFCTWKQQPRTLHLWQPGLDRQIGSVVLRVLQVRTLMVNFTEPFIQSPHLFQKGHLHTLTGQLQWRRKRLYTHTHTQPHIYTHTSLYLYT